VVVELLVAEAARLLNSPGRQVNSRLELVMEERVSRLELVQIMEVQVVEGKCMVRSFIFCCHC